MDFILDIAEAEKNHKVKYIDEYRCIVDGKHYLLTLSNQTKNLEWRKVNL